MDTFLFKNNFHFLRVNNFLLFLIHTSVARGALQAMTFGAAILAGVALPSPPECTAKSRRELPASVSCVDPPTMATQGTQPAKSTRRQRGEPQSHAPSSCRQKPNNPVTGFAGHKTTPPGRESPTENQTLGHAVLQMS